MQSLYNVKLETQYRLRMGFHLIQKDNFLRQIQFGKIITTIDDAFRTGKYIHYQAVSHTENQNLQLFLRSKKLRNRINETDHGSK